MQMKKTRATDYRSLPSLWSHSLHHELELTTDTTQDRKNEHCLLRPPASNSAMRASAWSNSLINREVFG